MNIENIDNANDIISSDNENVRRDNFFTFTLTQGSEHILFCEKQINANQYSPVTRYSVNLKDVMPRFIYRLQRVLSQKSYSTTFESGGKNVYDFLDMNHKQINSYKPRYRENMLYVPKPSNNENKRGVEFMFVLRMNEHIILEHEFCVEGFNSASRYSNDLVDEFNNVIDSIEAKLRKIDIRNMWDDYDIINKFNMNIKQIRTLSPSDRHRLIDRIYRN